MKWKDEYSTGVDEIDAQHKRLFLMSEDYGIALDEGGGELSYASLLDVLSAYAEAHFGFEESCMLKHSCPVAEKNKQAHDGLLNVLSEFRDRYAAQGYRREDAQHLVETLNTWLGDHICRIDVHLKNCVTG